MSSQVSSMLLAMMRMAIMGSALLPSLATAGGVADLQPSLFPCCPCICLRSEMKEGSEKCDGPLCDGMSMIVTGDILRYPKVGQQHQQHLQAPT